MSSIDLLTLPPPLVPSQGQALATQFPHVHGRRPDVYPGRETVKYQCQPAWSHGWHGNCLHQVSQELFIERKVECQVFGWRNDLVTHARTCTHTHTRTHTHSHFDADDYIARGAKAAKMDNSTAPVRWTNVQVPVSSSPSPSTSRAETAAVVGQSGHDARRWNRLHYDALRNPELFQQLLDQYRAQNREVPDVNAPGPSGYTPLMLAVMKRPPVAGMDVSGVPFRGSSSSDSSGDSTVAEHTALIAWSNSRRMANRSSGGVPGHQNGHYFQPVDSTVPALISAGANIDAVNDMGHTALHLAAAYGQGEYVKKLLAAGADPNIQDSWGQSAVHAAIGASAEGAFLVSQRF